jgi:ParB family transcriptional regulator, chromosome partitioning protein
MDENVTKIVGLIKSTTDPVEVAKLLIELKKDYHLKTKDIAAHLGTTASYISNIMRILSLPDFVLDGYYSNLISYTHLLILSRIKDKDKILHVYDDVIKAGASTQKAEELVFESLYSDKQIGEKLPKDDIDKLEKNMARIDSDIKLKIIQTRRKAYINIWIEGNRKKTSEILKKIISQLS